MLESPRYFTCSEGCPIWSWSWGLLPHCWSVSHHISPGVKKGVGLYHHRGLRVKPLRPRLNLARDLFSHLRQGVSGSWSAWEGISKLFYVAPCVCGVAVWFLPYRNLNTPHAVVWWKVKHFHKPKEVELPSFFQALNIRMYGCLLKHITGVYWWCEEFWRVQGYAVSSDSARARKNWLYGALACKWIMTQKHFSAIECFLLLNIKRRAEKPQNQARIKGSCSKGLGERKRKCTVWWRYFV